MQMMGRQSDTDMGGSGQAFPSTQWSFFDRILRDGDGDAALIDGLLKRYWKPVYCYLRRKGYRNEQAKDLTQGFFHEIVLNRHLLSRADSSKGRFRALLRHALDQYVSDERTRERTRKRWPGGGLISLEAMDLPALPRTISSLTPEDCYNYTWLCDLLEQILAEVEADCRRDGLDLPWTIFRERIVQPSFGDHVLPSLKELCDKYGIDDEKKVSNMLITVKRRFQAAIRRHVRNTVASDQEVDEEVQELFQYLP
jgi:DNA-directed RNA polymerase specialized sigma24 family protein